MRELADVDAQIRLVDDVFRKAGEARHLFDDLPARGGSERVTLGERERVIAGRELLGELAGAGEIFGEIGRKLAMIAGDIGEGGKKKRVGLVVGLGGFERLVIQDGGKQRDAVEGDSLAAEV